MNWEGIKDMYEGLEPADIWSIGDWLSGSPSQYDTPNYTQVNPLYGSVTGWGSSPEEKQRLSAQMDEGINNRAMSLGMMGGTTKIVGSGPSKLIEAWHNEIPNLKVGQLGYAEAPKFNVLKDIKVDPAYRGQGYGKELMDAFTSQGEPRFGGTITNSPGFWGNLSEKMRGDYPTFAKGLDTALDFAKRDFGW